MEREIRLAWSYDSLIRHGSPVAPLAMPPSVRCQTKADPLSTISYQLSAVRLLVYDFDLLVNHLPG
jgi:hypothetical protein